MDEHTKGDAVERSIVDRMLWSGERNITRLNALLLVALLMVTS